jgi:GT2 family glycosyltransferase
MLSILIPTWNNLPYLRLCVDSLRRHSAEPHEILVHVNDGSDGTLQWVRQQELAHTHSSGNVGVCLALNQLAARATGQWLLFLNDDMFCTPGWDSALAASARAGGSRPVFLSSMLVEPTVARNDLVRFANFGTDPSSFDEKGLLAFAAASRFGDIDGAASQPTLVRRADWNLVGGYSIEFSPGMSSDDDFLMKLWLAGCRSYRVIGSSIVYHFACKSTHKVRRNQGGREFLLKWGISQRAFKRNCIARTASGDAASLPNVPAATWKCRLKRVLHSAARYPLADLKAWEPDLPAKSQSDANVPPERRS